MTAMRIVHIVSARCWGGMEARTVETARWQAGQGHEVLVVSAEGGATAAAAREAGLDAYTLDFDRGGLGALLGLRRRLRAHGAEVVDFHTNRSFALGLMDICPLVRSRHNLRKKAPRRGLPKTFPYARVIVTSEAERSHLIASGATGADRIAVVGEWAEERFFEPLAAPNEVAAQRRRLGLAEDAMVIGACGMLRQDNAFDQLIQATARLRAWGHPVQCLIVGGASEACTSGTELALRRQARALGVADCVHFLGHRADVPQLLDAMDVTAIVSRHTAQTRVGPEAAARGRAVVGFRVGALAETVAHGQTGLLVPPGDQDAFVRGLESLLVDVDQRRRLGATAAALAQTSFRQGPKMELTLQAYREAAEQVALPHSALGVHPLSLVEAG